MSTGGRQNDLFIQQRAGFLSTRLLFFFSRFLSVGKVSPQALSVNGNIHVLRDNCRALNTTRHGSECSAPLVLFPPVIQIWANRCRQKYISLCVRNNYVLWVVLMHSEAFFFFLQITNSWFFCVCFVLFSLVPADSLNVKQWCEKHWEQSGLIKRQKTCEECSASLNALICSPEEAVEVEVVD